MVATNSLSYDAWKEYLKNDKDMNSKWKSLIELWENVKKDLKENLNSLPYSEALKRRRFLTARNIFNIISTAKEKPNFDWKQKLIFNEKDERDEYVIQCKNPSSDYIFRRIKEERWVANMHWESINKYLQPVADKIWALKETLRVSIQTETKPSDLSYEALKTDRKIFEWSEKHYESDNKNTWNEKSEKNASKRKEPVQLTIQFPEDDWSDSEQKVKKEDDDPNQDELYNDSDDDYEYDWQRRNNN